MTLVVDRRAEFANKPALHALIAGVSRYTHLQEAEFSFGLSSLDSTARTANIICEWLKKADADGRLPLPLASVRLLLSRSDAEADLPNVDECTWGNFAREAKAWRTDASGHNGSMTFFYFAGHGIQLPPQRAILLMSDYGNPNDGAPLDSAIDMQHILFGMVPPADVARRIARTQFYFVDACRSPVGDLSELDRTARSPWSIPDGGVDNRSIPTFYGAPPGLEANALPGAQTLFSEALLECLDGLGAVGPENDDPRWRVTSQSLADRMTIAIERVNAKYKDKRAKQSFSPNPSSKATLVYLNEPPLVDVQLQIDPPAAVNLFRIDVADDEENALFTIEPIEPHPHPKKLRAGTYAFRARLLSPPHPEYENRSKLLPVNTPAVPCSWIAKVKA